MDDIKTPKSRKGPKNTAEVQAELEKYINKTVTGAVNRQLKTNKEKLHELEVPPTLQKTENQESLLRDLAFSNIKYRQIPVYGVRPADTVTQVRTILDSINQGIFYWTALFVDAIFEDERIWACSNVRLNSLVSSKIDILPADDSKKALKIKKACEKSFEKIIPPSQISSLLRWGLYLGVGFANVSMVVDNNEYLPQIEIWHPRFARYDWTTRQYKIVTDNLGEVFVEPDDPSWMVLHPFGDDLPWMKGMVRPLAMPYLMRYWTRQWWTKYQETNGKPIVAGIVPPTATEEDEARFIRELGQLAYNSVVRLPQGIDGNRYDIQLIQASADLYKGFEAFLKYIDSSIAITILGQDYSTSGAPGFGSVENPGRAIREEIRKHDARIIQTLIREKLLKPWAQANFGNADLAPYIKFDVEIKEDLLQKAQHMNTLFAALINANGILPVDTAAILSDFDVPQLEPEAFELLKKQVRETKNTDMFVPDSENEAQESTKTKAQEMKTGVKIKSHEDAVPDVKSDTEIDGE